MRKALIILHDYPYPPNHGGRYDMFYRLKSLHKIGIELDVICTIDEEQYPSKEQISLIRSMARELIILKRNKSIRSLLSTYPFQLSSRNNKSVINYFKGKNRSYDFVLLEDFYVWQLYKNIEKLITTKKTLIRLHNNNFKYFLELGKASFSIFKKIFFFQEALKFLFLEIKTRVTRSDLCILPISYDDYTKLKNQYSSIFWLPPAIDISIMKPYKKYIGREINILFVGNLFTDNNIEGIIWFIKKVHPTLTKKIVNYRLMIAGKTKGKNPIGKYLKLHRNIYFFDSPSPKDLENIYSKAMIFINPILKGAGVKIKNIDAIIHGIPVITTSKGNEGTGLIDEKHVLVANKPQKFIKTIESLVNNENLRRNLVINAQKFLRTEYDHEKRLKRILGLT